MNMYLYIVRNEHPEVMTRYRYIVLSTSRLQAIKDMVNRDGGTKPWCIVESCELVRTVECNTWYLPMNEKEPL